MFSIQHASAKIWRVNYMSNYDAATSKWGDNVGGTALHPVFAQLDDANTSTLVSNGVGVIDTLYVEGTENTYAAVTFTKPVIVIGTGYFLNENPNVSSGTMESQVSSLAFGNNSDNSQIIGLHVISSNGINLNGKSNIIIKRCRIEYYISLGSGNDHISIEQNYFSNLNSANGSAISVSSIGFPTHFIFNNNICKRQLLLYSGTTIYDADQCNNNVFDCPALFGGLASIKFHSGECRNNIIRSTGIIVDVNATNTNFTNNTSAIGSDKLGNDASNVITDVSSLFVASGSTDGAYQLVPSAQTIGFDGYQVGAFGGPAITNQYTLSGLGAIPVIYSIQTSGVSDNTGLPVKIKARIIN